MAGKSVDEYIAGLSGWQAQVAARLCAAQSAKPCVGVRSAMTIPPLHAATPSWCPRRVQAP